MDALTRRSLLAGVLGTAGGGLAYDSHKAEGSGGSQAGPPPLALKDYSPKPALHVPETKVPRSRFPVIDCHVHLSTLVQRQMPSSDVPLKEGAEGPQASMSTRPEDVIALMNRKNIRLMVNVTGGYGPALDEAIRYWHKPYPDRFLVCVEPWWTRTNETGYAKFQADEIERAARAGARGVKVLKTLGLYLRENLKSGPLVKVDDRRFDPMWEAAGALRLPVLIHVSDPESFFDPVDRFNERYLDLLDHPDWSFYDRDFPSDRELQEARNRVIARHPHTHFLILHFGDVQNLAYMSEVLDRYPNATVEFGARIDELGRQPRVAMKFFDKYQDRILFGTDAVPHGDEYPQQVYGDALYQIYYRFLETEDEYFDYSPAKVPPQGRWRIYGLGLPEVILRKVYHDNAARLLAL